MMMRTCSGNGCNAEVAFKESHTPEPARRQSTINDRDRDRDRHHTGGRHSQERLAFPKIDSRFCIDREPSMHTVESKLIRGSPVGALIRRHLPILFQTRGVFFEEI